MAIHSSGEDYLEAIRILRKEKGMVRSIDLAQYMGYSRPSVSYAVKRLQNEVFLFVDQDGHLLLTDTGQQVAEKIYERHLFFTEQLMAAGVDQKIAEQDACRMEHAISDDAFRKLKKKVRSSEP